MNRGTMIAVAVVCTVGLTVGFSMRRVLFPKERIAVYPSTVRLNDGNIEGQPLEIHFELKNESRWALTVKSVSASCGCMAISADDRPLKTPFVLDGGGTLPITLSIATVARIGPQTFSLWVHAEGPHGPLETVAGTVQVNLLGTLRAQPSMVIFRRAKTGAALSAEVELADMLPDPGVRIREVTTSNPDNLRVDVVDRSAPSTVFGQSVTAHCRATLKILYVPRASKGRVQEMISIVPENKEFPTLRIPVYCEIAEGPYRFVPQGLTITPDGKQRFRRTVIFQTDDGGKELSVVKVPAGIQVEFGARSASSWPVRISGTTADLAQGESQIVFMVDDMQLAFPIRRMP
jgi:Protein of unknown function (DUF1573)